MDSITDEHGSGVFVQFPLPENRLFRNQAIEDILLLLLRNPHGEFSVTDLRELTGHGGDTVQTALEVLTAASLISSRREGRKKLVSANSDRFHNPDDPPLAVPQDQFRAPIKAFLDEMTSRYEDSIVGVILFGSVARGEADRTSDIDLQVIVEDDLPSARRKLHEIRQDIEARTFDGDRYEFQLLVESVASVESYGPELRNIFSEGITLYDTAKLRELREVVLGGRQ